jgi:hypothetical protein
MHRVLKFILNKGMFVGFTFYAFTSIQAQNLLPQKIASPNTTAFEKFGDVPVSLFTGVPDISVPLHTVSYGKINVPISLRYHPGSLRLQQHPGWVGQG